MSWDILSTYYKKVWLCDLLIPHGFLIQSQNKDTTLDGNPADKRCQLGVGGIPVRLKKIFWGRKRKPCQIVISFEEAWDPGWIKSVLYNCNSSLVKILEISLSLDIKIHYFFSEAVSVRETFCLSYSLWKDDILSSLPSPRESLESWTQTL